MDIEENVIYVKAKTINEVRNISAKTINDVKSVGAYSDKTHIYEQQAEAHATTAKHYADVAKNYAENSKEAEIWAEGTDEEVKALGGTHSAKTWAEILAGGTGGQWGTIIGDITEQYDLMEQLDQKANTDYVNELVTGFESSLGDKVSTTDFNVAVGSFSEAIANVEDKITEKQDKLKAGDNITIKNNVISAEDGINNKISNCLLEVPQNIKLELNDGVLTLKAGSKVIVPNGANNFDEIITTQDYSVTTTANTTCTVYYSTTYNKIEAFSGVSSSSDADIETTGVVHYNTTANKITRTNNSGTSQQLSFPIAKIVLSGSTVTEIKEVFQGIGYIGSTIWVDKGVKGLIPNGRNEDGTLKNTKIETSQVLTRTYNYSANNQFFLTSWGAIGTLDLENCSYNSEQNINVNLSSNTFYNACAVGIFTTTNGVISNFQPKQAFRAVDYNDIKEIKDSISIETYTNGTSWYRIYPKDETGYRWCEQGGQVSLSAGTTTTVNLLVDFKDRNYSVFPGGNFSPGSKTVSSFIATPNGMVTSICDWEAKGYIK